MEVIDALRGAAGSKRVTTFHVGLCTKRALAVWSLRFLGTWQPEGWDITNRFWKVQTFSGVMT